jgi:hypothetical protein
MSDERDTSIVTEPLFKISSLATQIPSSSSFVSASLAHEILEYTRQVQRARAKPLVVSESNNQSSQSSSATPSRSSSSGGGT